MSVVLLEHPAEGVALLRLNRPEALNALNLEVREALAVHFEEFAGDEAVRCIVITGNERAFAAGADLKEMVDKTADDMDLLDKRGVWRVIAAVPQPVIAAVNGFALGGGCELAMHADIIVAGEGAEFGQPEVRVGIMPGGGGTQRLVRAVGKFKAMKLLLTGDRISAAEASAMGLVSEVVADEKTEERALELARTIARMPPLAVRRIKETVLRGADDALDVGLAGERQAFNELFDTADQEEGMRAFIEKRKPEFKGE